MKIQRDLTGIGLSTLILIFFGLSIAAAESGISNRKIFVGTSARALGMGSAFTAGPPSSDSSFWNPSSLGFLKATELSLVGLPFAEESDDREGAFSLAFNPQQLRIATKNVGNFSISSWFDGWGNDDETNRLVLVGYGIPLGKEIAAGASIRHHRRNRSVSRQFGWSFDLGVLFSRKLKRPADRIALGLTFEDLGGHIWENGRLIEKMPPVTRLGAAYYLKRDTILSGDFVLHNDKRSDFQDRLRTHLGVERWFLATRFGLRLGYTAIANADQFTAGEWSTGFSLRSESGQLDYAYVRGSELDRDVHWISATLRWGGSPGEPPMTQPPITNIPTPPPTQPSPIVMPKQIVSVLTVSEEAISPNGDGVREETVFDFEIAEEGAWRLEIRDDCSKIVQTYFGTGLPSEEVVWDGQDVEGNLVSDGTYTAQLFFLNEGSDRHLQSRTVITVDTMPVDLKISAEPLILAPSDGMQSSGDVIVNVPTVHVQASDLNPIAHWELQFFDGAGERIDQIRENGEPPDTIVWNNWHGHPLPMNPNADYHCMLMVHDIAGNRSTDEASLSFVDISQRNLMGQQEALEERKDARGIVLTLSGVAFGSNAYEIRSEYRPVLEEAAQAIAAYPDAQVIIEGHTDDVGEASYNLELSRKRANAVMTYLVNEFGIDPSRLSAISYGEEKPIAPNDTQSNLHKNRRVEIVLLTVEGALPPAKEMEVRVAPNNFPEVSEEPSTATPKYTLLVSSFKNRENAELLVESLEALNLSGEIRLAQVTIRSEPWYRVLVGRFHEKKEAAPFISQIKAQGIEPLVISAGGTGN